MTKAKQGGKDVGIVDRATGSLDDDGGGSSVRGRYMADERSKNVEAFYFEVLWRPVRGLKVRSCAIRMFVRDISCTCVHSCM